MARVVAAVSLCITWIRRMSCLSARTGPLGEWNSSRSSVEILSRKAGAGAKPNLRHHRFRFTDSPCSHPLGRRFSRYLSEGSTPCVGGSAIPAVVLFNNSMYLIIPSERSLPSSPNLLLFKYPSPGCTKAS